ncbi:MAG TPA: carboxypeptidase-like regulatory domain-containing protein [Acidobacteriaceae bacterium]|nr:carboxypeptidase-like regulatory domain-containing protein [Acidobacteriaceae bacterium]
MKHRNETYAAFTTVLRNALFLVCSLCVGAFLPSALGQLSTTGSINGTVVDTSGALIAGAKVTIVQSATHTVTQTVSNSDGNFVQNGLNSGHYEVTIAAPGFANYRETNIYLEPMAIYTVHAMLKVGNDTTTVTVTGTEATVQITTPEISNTVSGEEAQELPLNGRNFEQLGSLMPGVINTSPVATMGTGGYSTTNSLLVNGGTTTGSPGSGETGAIYYLDGLWISSNVVHDENIVTPNPDEIAEVKALQNNFSAQYSLMGASVVVVQTKSGTGSYHGGAWEFLRNTDLNATQYFSHTPTAMNWNIFGYDLGGPLFIPKIYEAGRKRTFFYFNQQWVRQKAGSQATGASPLAEMRGQGTPNGELLFPGTSTSPIKGIGGPYGIAFLADPSLPAGHCKAGDTKSCFAQDTAGNWIIPANRVDKNALALLNALVPLPNNLAGGTYTSTSSSADYLNTNPNITNQVDVFGKVDHDLTSKLRLSGEYMVEEQTFTGANAARFGSPWTTNYDIFETDDQAFQVRLTQILSPAMTNQTSASIGIFDGTHDFGGIRMISQVPGFQQTLPFTGSYLQNYLPNIQLSAPWSKFGTSSNYIVPRATELHDTVTDDWSWLRKNHFLQAGITFLLGTERHWASPTEVEGHFTFNGYATGNAMPDYLLGLASNYAQNSAGLRTIAHYKIISPYVEDTWHVARHLTISGGLRYSFMPWPNEQAGVIDDFNPALYDPNQAPKINIGGTITSAAGSYNPANGIMLNGRNGVPLNLTGVHPGYWSPVGGFAWDMFGNGKTSVRGGYGLTYYETASQGCDEGICLGYPTITQVNLATSNFDSPAGASPPPTIPNVRGIDLKNYRASHIHTYSLSVQQQFGSNWIASIAGAASNQRAGSASTNINQPGPVTINGVSYDFDPTLNKPGYVAGYFAPYQGYGSIDYYQNIGVSNWDALELSLKHHTTRNLYLTAAYTWSHSLDNFGGFQNSHNIAASYGDSGNDIPQVFTVSAIYYLPRLEHSRWWMKESLGGWQYSDMTTLQSGGTSSVGLSGPNLGLATRPNQIAPITYSKDWRSTTNHWFSPSSFAQPAAGYFGNVGNGIIRNPGVEVFNMALYKTFPFTERVHLQFRAEFFNVFNHSNPNGPNTTVGSPAIGTITGEKEAREGEGSLKLTF